MDEVAPKRWRFQIRDLLVWTAVAGATLAVARITFPAPGESGRAIVRNYFLNVKYHADPLFLCLGAMPPGTTAAFHWRWLPAAIFNALAACLLATFFDHWLFGQPLLAGLPMEARPWVVAIFSAGAHAAVLLLVLRWQGYRLTRVAGHYSSATEAGTSR